MRQIALAPFIVLIESRSARCGFVGVVMAALMLAMLCGPCVAHAGKVAADLRQAVHATATPGQPWARDVSGVRYVKALVVSSSADPELTELRAHVVAVGGAVYHRYVSVAAL